ncbi:MAG: hypothetical protein PHV68_01925 [Candidatus Gastranaerophilales bacterium]|nr:hypothetical protein [Candidatus Gastranaerophilales bacterium]
MPDPTNNQQPPQAETTQSQSVTTTQTSQPATIQPEPVAHAEPRPQQGSGGGDIQAIIKAEIEKATGALRQQLKDTEDKLQREAENSLLTSYKNTKTQISESLKMGGVEDEISKLILDAHGFKSHKTAQFKINPEGSIVIMTDENKEIPVPDFIKTQIEKYGKKANMFSVKQAQAAQQPAPESLIAQAFSKKKPEPKKINDVLDTAQKIFLEALGYKN